MADDQRTADTRFYSVGGGGYVGPHGGSVQAPQIRSVTDNHQTIWITDDNGRDHSVGLTNVSVPLRVGQKVTAYFCCFENSTRERCEYLLNRSAQLGYNLSRSFAPLVDFKRRYRKGALLRIMQWAAFAGMVLSTALYFYSDWQDDEALKKNAAMPICGRLFAMRRSELQGARDEIKRTFEVCRANYVRHMAAQRNLRVLPLWAFCGAGAWMGLSYVVWLRRGAYGRRLHAEYLDALDRTFNG